MTSALKAAKSNLIVKGNTLPIVRRGQQWGTSSLRLCAVVLISTWVVHGSSAAPTEDIISAPYAKCFNRRCDLRTQYCDQGIGQCSNCESDCHPVRISGNSDLEQDCRQKCGWYFVWKEYKESVTAVTITTEKTLTEGWSTELSQWSMVHVGAFFALVLIVVLLAITNIIAWCIICRFTRRQHRARRVYQDSVPHYSDSLLISKLPASVRASAQDTSLHSTTPSSHRGSMGPLVS